MNEASEKVVHGARCVWWNTLDKAGKTPPGHSGHSLPCCPFCGGVLYEMPIVQWWEGVKRYESEGHVGYRKFVEWWRGKCFPNLDAARTAYVAETGEARP